jgi:hypothetical protein
LLRGFDSRERSAPTWRVDACGSGVLSPSRHRILGRSGAASSDDMA